MLTLEHFEELSKGPEPHTVTHRDLTLWLLANWSESKQIIAERLLRDFTIAPRPKEPTA